MLTWQFDVPMPDIFQDLLTRRDTAWRLVTFRDVRGNYHAYHTPMDVYSVLFYMHILEWAHFHYGSSCLQIHADGIRIKSDDEITTAHLKSRISKYIPEGVSK